MTDKLIDFLKGELVIEDYIILTTGSPLAANQEIGLLNGNYSVLKDVKISFNNNEVEHNREPLYATTYLNLLEDSDDYSKSIATQYGFDKDTTNTINSVRYVAQKDLVRGSFDAGNSRYPVTLPIPLKHISKFFRRLQFPIMDQLVEIEFNFSNVESILLCAAPV